MGSIGIGYLRLHIKWIKPPLVSTPLNDREFTMGRNLGEGFDSAQP